MLDNDLLQASIRTDQGQIRDHNEDFIGSAEPVSDEELADNGWLFIVADGVGGAEAGEVASEFATERTIHHYLNDQQSTNFGQRLVSAIEQANEELIDLAGEQKTGRRMATTIVAAAVQANTAFFANVGDSRGYHWRDGELRQITKDQSLVAKLVEEGVITEEEALTHPRKNVILQSLGSEERPLVDLFEVELNTGEMLVMCSDGLIRHLTDDEINVFVSELDPAEATANMIDLANERGGEDNISVAVLRIGDMSIFESHDLVAEVSSAAGTTPNGKSSSDSESDRGAFWYNTATLTLMYLFLVLLVWILTGR